VRISDRRRVHRDAPQWPDDVDETRDMPTGRLVLRAYSPRYNTAWQHEWTESQKGESVMMAKAIVDALEEAAPIFVKQVQDAEHRERERQARFEIERRRRQARDRDEARQRARQAANEELRSIVTAWNDAFALEAFFSELARCASMLNADERTDLEARIQTARVLTGGQDAVDPFLKWKLRADSEAQDENAASGEAGGDRGDED